MTQAGLLLEHHYGVDVFVPDQAAVQSIHVQLRSQSVFPYWAKLWPSALALAAFLHANKELLTDKKILELAAGLGLPSLVAAAYARHVCCSDYTEEPLGVVQQSILHNCFTNIHCEVLNWFHLPDTLRADLLLLSDVNYEPASFDALERVFMRFLLQGTTIILSTPQRLMAKPFIERLLPFCTRQEEMMVTDHGATCHISIFVFKV